LLSGEAGIGKSRLTRGIIDSVSTEAHTLRTTLRVALLAGPLAALVTTLLAAAFVPDRVGQQVEGFTMRKTCRDHVVQ
jgi:hypothetical protein